MAEHGYIIVNMAGDQAEQEMIRLQALNPRAEFVLFGALAEAIHGLYERGSLEIVELTP